MESLTPTLEYFLENPKGHLLRSHIQKRFPEFYDTLMNYPSELQFSERVYWYFHNLKSRPVCTVCGGPVRFISFSQGYGQFCSLKCATQSKERTQKIRSTMMERYGVENASQLESIKEKKRATSREHYGVDHPRQTEEVKAKQKRTTLERYGVENASQSDIIKEKKRATSREHYGVDHPSQSSEVKAKQKRTTLERYGVDNILKLPEVKLKVRETSYKKFLKDHDEVLDIQQLDGTIIYTCKCTHEDCQKCQERTFQIPNKVFNNRWFSGSELCTKLLPVDNQCNSNGTLELFIQRILDRYNIAYVKNDRKVLRGKELDIYIPSMNLAVECNGVYWHSMKDSHYHYDKWKQCKEKDIQLLTIWEDQIVNKPEIIQNILLSKLKVYEHTVGARQCTLKEVSSKESSEFLTKYHLQGSVNGSVRYGLYYNEELVSVMVFGKKRTSLGNKRHDTWELYRYCCKGGWSIVGGAQRLFTHFCKDHPNTTIESFSSNDISDGELYERLGFTLQSEQMGSYWYIDHHMNRYHRYTFRKDKLVREGADPSKTEFQITDEMGLWRIFDSGQQKWIISI